MSQWIYGRNAVHSLIQSANPPKEIRAAQSMTNDPLVKQAYKAGSHVVFVSRDELTRLTGTDKHQGFAAEAPHYRTYTLQELIDGAKTSQYPLIILLDGLEDPHNLGAVLRTADAVGADGVVYAKNRSVSLSPTVAKVSTGAIDTVRVAEVTNLSRSIDTLKNNGYWIVGADNADAQDYRTVDYKCPIALVIGSEGFGISRLVLEKCDFRIGLPMKGKVNSLNASVAAGILMYAVQADRFPAKKGENHGRKKNQ